MMAKTRDQREKLHRVSWIDCSQLVSWKGVRLAKSVINTKKSHHSN
jgi:hypothetical protein